MHEAARSRTPIAAFVVLCAAVSVMTAPARADVGDGDDGLLGLRRLHVAGERHQAIAFRLRLGYGFTEEVPEVPGTHHRLDAGAAVGFTPLRWLGVGLRLDGRYDRHSANDSGYVQNGGVELRATPRIGDGPLSLGARFGLTLHGDDDFGLAVWKAATMELALLAALAFDDTTIAVELGYRIDRSGRTVAGQVFSLPDRLALGVTDFDAALVRLGVSHRFGAVAIFGEYALDALAFATRRTGDGAPSIGESPSHLTLGARVFAGPVQIEGIVDVALSQRPVIVESTALFPVDPRVTVGVAATYRLDFEDDDSDEDVEESASDDDDDVTDEGVGTSGANVDVGDGNRTLEGRVRDGEGQPLVDARVRIFVGGSEVDAYTDGEGRFRISGLPNGEGRVEVTASGHEPRGFAFGAGAITWPSEGVSLPQATTSVIRGTVRAFDGEAITPTVRIDPGARSVSVDAEGGFAAEVPPGRYTVVVSAPGYTSQRREVRVSVGEVTVLNVDLHRSTR